MSSRLNRINGHLREVAKPLSLHGTTGRFTKADVLKKRDEGLCYIVVRNKVYDVTDFLEEHPGGAEIITDINAGDFEQQTFDFDEAEHSEEAMEDLEEFYKGDLVEDGSGGELGLDLGLGSDGEEDSEDEAEVVQPVELTEEMRAVPFAVMQECDLELIDSYQVSRDVVVYRFALVEEQYRLGLPVGKHLILSFKNEDGTVLTRPYTPVSPVGEQGFVDFLIKLYPTGKMSNHLQCLRYGDLIHVKGPKGHVEYFGRGRFQVKKDTRQLSRIGMIAGGSGITPMFQIIQQVANDAQDDLEINLLFANKTCKDILLRDQLERIASNNPNIRIAYTLDKPPEGWKHFSGYITAEMITAILPPPSEDSMIFLCGPPPMVKKACIPSLKELGYQYKKNYFTF